MYNMFQPPPFTHINIHMSLSFSVFIQPVVGTLAKFPKWHLFVIKNILFNWQLWAIMEISIPARSSFKSTLITYQVLLVAIKVIAFWEISPLAML